MPVRKRKPGEGIVSGQIHFVEFARQMDFLVDEGFTTITALDVEAWLAGKAELPPRPIVVDFDDHSMITYKNALPAMRERGLRATMYVISGIADGDPYLDGNPLADTEAWSVARMRWRELEKLVEADWCIGAHTRHALVLDRSSAGRKRGGNESWPSLCGVKKILKSIWA